MDEREVAIKVQSVVKTFRLPHQKINTVKGMFVNLFRRRTFETQKVLRGVSFEVKKGEFFGIVGRNGGGKSTLLKLLAGIYVPDSGELTVNGKLAPFIELGVGFNPELTGRENVYLNGALLGFNTKEVDAMYDDIVKFAELEEFMDQKLSNYSSGMQVRLAFSVAIQSKADILLIDEVLAVGDSNFQKKCFDTFETFKQEGRTVVFVSHSMEMVKRFCDRVILIDKGEIATEGDPYAVTSQYEIINDERLKERGAGLVVANSREADIIGRVTGYLSPREKIVYAGTPVTRDIELLESYGFNFERYEDRAREGKPPAENKPHTVMAVIEKEGLGTLEDYKKMFAELDGGILQDIYRVYVHLPFYAYLEHESAAKDTKIPQVDISDIAKLLNEAGFVMLDYKIGGVNPGWQYTDAIFDRLDDEKKRALWDSSAK